MTRLMLTAVAAVFAGCAGPNQLTDRDTNRHATFLLTNPGGGQCSGVVLTEDGYILTAAHCLDADTTHLEVNVDTKDEPISARVVAYDARRDLALLKTHGFRWRSTARLHAGRVLKAGDTIYHVGHPFGGRGSLPQLFGVGHIMHPNAELGELLGTRWIFIDLETGRPGASGSGAYDAETGGLIGMVDAVATIQAHGFDAMSVVMLVPYGYIRTFLRENGLELPTTQGSASREQESQFPQLSFSAMGSPRQVVLPEESNEE